MDFQTQIKFTTFYSFNFLLVPWSCKYGEQSMFQYNTWLETSAEGIGTSGRRVMRESGG